MQDFSPQVNLSDQGQLSKNRGFPGSSDGKESACNMRDLGSILELGRSPEKTMATHSSILDKGDNI